MLMAFSQLDGSPFLDDRVRRAVSMLIDRDTFIDVFYNVQTFKDGNFDTAAICSF